MNCPICHKPDEETSVGRVFCTCTKPQLYQRIIDLEAQVLRDRRLLDGNHAVCSHGFLADKACLDGDCELAQTMKASLELVPEKEEDW